MDSVQLADSEPANGKNILRILIPFRVGSLN